MHRPLQPGFQVILCIKKCIIKKAKNKTVSHATMQ